MIQELKIIRNISFDYGNNLVKQFIDLYNDIRNTINNNLNLHNDNINVNITINALINKPIKYITINNTICKKN